MKYNTKITEEICKIPVPKINKLLRGHAKQPIEIQVEAHKLASDLYYQYRDKYPDSKNEVRYSVFILALQKMEHFDHVLMEKNPDHDFKKNKNTTEIKADNFLTKKKTELKKQKPAKKREKLITHWEEIQMLRNKGFSFRLIAEFLKTNYNFKIHWTYIEKIWKELE